MPSSLDAGRSGRPWIVHIIGVVALALAACSAPGAAPSTPAPQATIASAAPVPAPSESSSGGGRGDYDYIDPMATNSPDSSDDGSGASGSDVEVATATGPLGTYLTGADGLTLYTFKPDSPNTSTCDGGCAEAWPPFTVASDAAIKAGTGVDKSLTTFARTDGSLQVAYDGAPLYYFANDTSAGDTNGQGLGDNWFVAKS